MKVKAQISQCFRFAFFFGILLWSTTAFSRFHGCGLGETEDEESATFVHFGAKIASEINQNVCVCVCVCFGHVVLAIPNIPTHPRRSPARTQRAMEESWSSAVEFEFAAQILCERKYFYLVNVIYYLCLFEHLSSAA